MMKQLLWIGLLASATSADSALSEFEFVGKGYCAVTAAGCLSVFCQSSYFFRNTDSQYQSSITEDCAREALNFGAQGFTVRSSPGSQCYLHPPQDPGLSHGAPCPRSGNCPAPSPYGSNWMWYNFGTSPILGVRNSSSRSCYRLPEPAPSENPTENPTEAPTKNPTENPTEAPTDPYPALCGASGATMAGSAQSVIENIETECICAAMCSGEPGCVYWVWNIKELTCALMDETATIGASNPGSVSGELVSYPTYEPTEGAPTENPTENPTEVPTENPTENPTGVCCKEINAECLSGLTGVTEEEFCDAFPGTLGCTVCCEALTAECLSCQLGLTVEEFCNASPSTPGCEVVDPCREYSHKGSCRKQRNCIWKKADKKCMTG